VSAAEPAWISVFIDLAAEEYDHAVRFWTEVTGYSLSPTRGVRGEFATLRPPAGRDYLRVQRLAHVPSRIHLDLHVAEVPSVGWSVQRFAAVEHVVSLARPDCVPVRVILQRLDVSDTGPAARAHLEWWTDDVHAEVARHRGLGARHVRDGEYWVVLADPAGLPYCVIGRDPDTGVR
jgi:hypothetical protein